MFRGGKVKQLTEEHHDRKGKLTRAIGVGEWYLLCTGCRKLRKKERILICSDGFYRNLDIEELGIWNQRRIENSSQADRMLKQIFHKKLSNGEQDNISALYFGYMRQEKQI